jgi:hypothetical protein
MSERFRIYQLKLKPRKCVLFTKSVEFLGRKVSTDGLEIGKQHLRPVQDSGHDMWRGFWGLPTTIAVLSKIWLKSRDHCTR